MIDPALIAERIEATNKCILCGSSYDMGTSCLPSYTSRGIIVLRTPAQVEYCIGCGVTEDSYHHLGCRYEKCSKCGKGLETHMEYNDTCLTPDAQVAAFVYVGLNEGEEIPREEVVAAMRELTGGVA